MPEIRDIDEFKEELIRLGNEPEIRSSRGEGLPEITVPETEAADDLSALFADEDSFTDDAAGDAGFPETGVESDDFDLGEEDGLDQLPDDMLDELDESEMEEAGLSTDEEADIQEDEAEFTEDGIEDAFEGMDDFSVPDGLTEGLADDLDAEEAPEDMLPEVEEPDDFDFESTDLISEAEDALAEADELLNADEDDFSIPEGLTDDITDDAIEDFQEDIPEEITEEVPEEFENIESPIESEDDAFDFGDVDDDLSFDDAGADDEFSLPDEEPVEFGDEGTDEFELDNAGFDEPAAAGDDEISDIDLSAPEDEDDGFSDEEDFSLEDFSLGEIDDEDIEATEFSLGDLGQEFGVDEATETDMGRLENLEAGAADAGETLEEAFGDDYAIPDDEFIELKKTLGSLPRNLKILIEELIGEKNLTGSNLEKLLEALIAGAGAKELGAIVSKITGKKVKIPVQYERKSAKEYELEKSSIGYMLRENFVPMFRTAAITAAVLGLVIFLGFRFVYKPLHAESLYKKGYIEITEGNNEQANTYFNQAYAEWPKKNWFFDYADGFAEKRQYILAEEKYQQLLRFYPGDRDGILAYADLEFHKLGKYPEAESLLKDLLFDNQTDYDARLMLADTYMEWAREIDPAMYEEARFHYAKLLQQYGSMDVLLFRMLRYFIRTGNREEAMSLYNAFKANPKAEVEPDIYAELAGFLIDNNHLEDVREILLKAMAVDESLPEIHYELARYFDILDIPDEEEKALRAAMYLFENSVPLTRTRTGLLVDTYNRYGEELYRKEMYIDAGEYFQKAATNYEEALLNRQLTPDEKYGKIYSNLGDLAYYVSGNYDQALSFYEQAEKNLYSPLELKYKKGYLFYHKEDYRKALVEFYDTAGGFSVDERLLYSTANTLFNRNDFFLAEGYYTHLLDLLNREYSSINYLLIDEIPEHRALLENLMKVSNNLGVTKYRLYERGRDPGKNAEAMVLLTDSTEYYDELTRDPNTLVQPETVNLSYLNSRAIFYPMPDYQLQIYQDIPKDLTKLYF